MSDLYNADFYADKTLTLGTPITHPRIGYAGGLVDGGTVAASSSEAAFPSSALLNPFTYDFWKPSVFPATLTIDLTAQRAADYLGIAAHELAGCQIVLDASDDNVSYTRVTLAAIPTDGDIMLLFDEVVARYWRITLTGWATVDSLSLDFEAQEYSEGVYSAADSGGASIAVINIGKALAMPRAIYGGHAPGPLNRTTTRIPSESDGGQWLGQTVVRRGAMETFDFVNLHAPWYRQYFDPFAKFAQGRAFFAAWRPGTFADEVLYGTASGDMEPSNTGTIDFMSVSFSMKGYIGNGGE